MLQADVMARSVAAASAEPPPIPEDDGRLFSSLTSGATSLITAANAWAIRLDWSVGTPALSEPETVILAGTGLSVIVDIPSNVSQSPTSAKTTRLSNR